ncbi:MAG: citrate synthase [Chloracidobacterium sp.]|nr:citrate synthase [Chloracidobacterium sp.]
MTKPASTSSASGASGGGSGAGLRDVVAAPSSICFIDGEQGILSYRGYNIHDLARNSTFEEVVFLLWNGRLPMRGELDELTAQLNANRVLPAEIVSMLKSFPRSAIPMDALRTVVSALALYDPERRANSLEANRRRALSLTAQLATLVAAIDRIRNGKEPLDPKPGLSHAADFLYMLNGKEPLEVEARAMDIALILHADHEFNASTFAARVTAGTLADMYAAITSAVGALSGPLHGGANEQVMKMLLEIGSLEKVDKFVHNKLEAGEKIMGIGHAVYRTEDPRATHLRRMSEEIGKRQGDTKWFDMSHRIEEIVVDEMTRKQKPIRANVDFYSASTYYMLGIPVDLYTPIFAVSRIAGWTAHVLEQLGNNKLIRPRSEYTGEIDLKYIPIDQR